MKSIYTVHIALKMDFRRYDVSAVPSEKPDNYIAYLTLELANNILMILANYNTHFNTYDELTLQTIRENDGEYNRVVEHLLVMAGITSYGGGDDDKKFTIVKPSKISDKPFQEIYKKWLDLTKEAKFKREIKNFWDNNERLFRAKQSAGTAPMLKFLGKVSHKRFFDLHGIFCPGAKKDPKKGGSSDENPFPLGPAANSWIKGKPDKKSSDKKKLIRANVEERKSIVWENANMQFVLRI